ncbi:MAG: type II toxin-antitoxin system HicB family antitoxin [Magnetococcus sp. YQC-5]
MNTMLEIQISVALDIKKEGNWFVAWSPVLDVSSQGRTENEAYENAQEALQLFLETCLAMGTLNQVLKARRLQPSMEADAGFYGSRVIRIPIPMIQASHAEAVAG